MSRMKMALSQQLEVMEEMKARLDKYGYLLDEESRKYITEKVEESHKKCQIFLNMEKLVEEKGLEPKPEPKKFTPPKITKPCNPANPNKPYSQKNKKENKQPSMFDMFEEESKENKTETDNTPESCDDSSCCCDEENSSDSIGLFEKTTNASETPNETKTGTEPDCETNILDITKETKEEKTEETETAAEEKTTENTAGNKATKETKNEA